MNYQAIWDETVLRGRLQYLKFKRLTWLMETLLFLIAIFIVWLVPLPTWIGAPLLVLSALRVVTEAFNHDYLASYHNVADKWRFLYPFA